MKPHGDQETELEIAKSILAHILADGMWGFEDGRLGIDGTAVLDEEETAWLTKFIEETFGGTVK